jgi:amino acid transporter
MSQGNFVRVLNNKEVLALAFGAMIGWGWVVLAGGWVQSAGAVGAMLAFGIGGVAVILIGLTYAELASAMPLTGGEHVYSHRAFGMAGSFLCTWAIILGYVSVVAFEAVALPTVVEHLFPNYKDTYKPHYKKLNSDQKLDFDLLKKCSELLMQNEMSKTAEGKAKTLRKI